MSQIRRVPRRSAAWLAFMLAGVAVACGFVFSSFVSSLLYLLKMEQSVSGFFGRMGFGTLALAVVFMIIAWLAQRDADS